MLVYFLNQINNIIKSIVVYLVKYVAFSLLRKIDHEIALCRHLTRNRSRKAKYEWRVYTRKAQRFRSRASISVLYRLSERVAVRAGVGSLSTATPLGWYYILEHAASLRARYFECRFCHLWIYLASVTQHGRCDRPHPGNKLYIVNNNNWNINIWKIIKTYKNYFDNEREWCSWDVYIYLAWTLNEIIVDKTIGK